MLDSPDPIPAHVQASFKRREQGNAWQAIDYTKRLGKARDGLRENSKEWRRMGGEPKELITWLESYRAERPTKTAYSKGHHQGTSKFFVPRVRDPPMQGRRTEEEGEAQGEAENGPMKDEG